MTNTLRRLPSYWGVLSLLGLLLSLPWLPLSYQGEFEREPLPTRLPGAQSVATGPARPTRDDRFTLYVVNDRDEADRLSKQIDPLRAIVALILTKQDDDRLTRYILDTNAARLAAQIPEVTIIDLRK